MSQFELEFLTRHGVYHMDGSGAVGDSADGAEVTYENLRTAMDEAAKYGVSLEMIHIDPCASLPSPSLPLQRRRP